MLPIMESILVVCTRSRKIQETQDGVIHVHVQMQRGDETESSVRGGPALFNKINDDVCGFHPLLYATLSVTVHALPCAKLRMIASFPEQDTNLAVFHINYWTVGKLGLRTRLKTMLNTGTAYPCKKRL